MKIKGKFVQVTKHRPHRGLSYRLEELAAPVEENHEPEFSMVQETPSFPERGSIRILFDEAKRKHRR